MGVTSRREFLKTAGRAGLGTATALAFPNIISARDAKPTIKVVGTHVTLQEPIRQKAEKDLGIRIEFYPGGSAEIIHKASTDPGSFDLYEQWSNSIRVLWNARAIQPIEISRLRYWDEINDLTKKGRISPRAQMGAGDVPHKLLYVQDDGSLSGKASDRISFLPYVHNVDSYGYNSALIPRGIPYETESWSWLLDERYRGKVALVNEPTIGLFDMILAVTGKGLMQFKDMGNPTRQELDRLFEIMNDYRRKGQFRGVWTSVPQSAELMIRGEVTLESMFSPGVSMVNSAGIPCVYAAPKEGYRAWHGVMCLSRESKGERREAAYAFMNWWLSGWPGAFIARQGYYISNPQRSRPLMEKEEWDYWYEGKPAAKPLLGPDGRVTVKKGEVRNGGSYIKRFENIAVWNTVIDQYEYALLKWNDFLSTETGEL